MILTMIVVLIVASLVGYKVISGVPPLLHTPPLMSGMNALSGITVLGAIMVYAVAPAGIKVWAAIALILAMINVTGGFWVTERMLLMFKGKEEKVTD